MAGTNIITVHASGNFNKTDRFLHSVKEHYYMHKLHRYAQMGVEVLKNATPKDTGHTSDSWTYEIVQNPGETAVYWRNSAKTENGIPLVILLRYGHATKNGGFVEGIDFIDPAMKPIFQKMADEAWKEVVR